MLWQCESHTCSIYLKLLYPFDISKIYIQIFSPVKQTKFKKQTLLIVDDGGIRKLSINVYIDLLLLFLTTDKASGSKSVLDSELHVEEHNSQQTEKNINSLYHMELFLFQSPAKDQGRPKERCQMAFDQSRSWHRHYLYYLLSSPA